MINFKQTYKQAGFSLVEMMIVVAVIGITAAFAMPSYRTWIQNTRIRVTAESIQNGLQKAKTEALRHNARVRFTLNNDASWVVGCVTPVADLNGDGLADCPASIESSAASEASGDITVNTDSGNTILTFTNFGTRDPALAANEFNQISIDMNTSAMSAADSRNLDVRIGVGGNVKMCDPEVTAPDLRAC
jgi:type IV fimbrial biogenesis protein FimT